MVSGIIWERSCNGLASFETAFALEVILASFWDDLAMLVASFEKEFARIIVLISE